MIVFPRWLQNFHEKKRGRDTGVKILQLSYYMQSVLPHANKIFTLTSSIPIQPIYDDVFISKDALKIWENFEIFRDEAMTVYKNLKTIKGDQFFEDIVVDPKDWTKLYLRWYNDIDPIGEKLCPKSAALIKSMPCVRIAMFSVLRPGAKILPHAGLYKGCLRLHMGLMTPNHNDCFISINGETYSWRDGQVVLLDDTYTHYVHNNTDDYRVILFCDIDRPMNFIGRLTHEMMISIFGKLTTREN